jgi:hypothetical protein
MITKGVHGQQQFRARPPIDGDSTLHPWCRL